MVSAVNEESPESLAQCAGTLLICLNEAMFYIEHLLVEIEETTNEE